MYLLVFTIAVLVRFFGISSSMILIGDQGRDFFEAKRMIETGEIPLLGIPSSIPRFHQGPVFIYLLAIAYVLGGGSMLAAGLLAVLLSLFAIVVLYVLLLRTTNKATATLACLLLAFFPMALMHARMPYHIVPIPLAVVIYLVALMRLVEEKRFASFLAGLSFALVFQFELAAFPLLLPIIVLWYVRQPRRKRAIGELLLGTGIGLLPQLLHDATHNFSQLGGFLVWVGYRIVAAVVPTTSHSMVSVSTPDAIAGILTLIGTMMTPFSGIHVFFWIGLLLCSIVLVLKASKRWSIEWLAAGINVLLTLSFIIHRAPSEAYIPILFPTVAIVIASAVLRFPPLVRLVCGILIALSLISSTRYLQQTNYALLSIGESDWDQRRYGFSLHAQQEMVQLLTSLAGDRCVVLDSKERDATFPTLMMHLEYLIALDRQSQQQPCQRFLVDRSPYARQYWKSGPTIDLGAYWIRPVQ